MNRNELLHKLSTRSGFNEVVESHMSSQPTLTAAYQAAEAQHLTIFGRRHYASASSFRVNRSKFMKKKKK